MSRTCHFSFTRLTFRVSLCGPEETWQLHQEQDTEKFMPIFTFHSCGPIYLFSHRHINQLQLQTTVWSSLSFWFTNTCVLKTKVVHIVSSCHICFLRIDSYFSFSDSVFIKRTCTELKWWALPSMSGNRVSDKLSTSILNKW